MKLIYCRKCKDVVRLFPGKVRKCRCGSSSGKYTDGRNAWYKGDRAVPLGIVGYDLLLSIALQPDSGRGTPINAFVIPKECETFEKK